MKVRCISNTDADRVDPSIRIEHALSAGEVYEVIGIEAGDYRVLDDLGSPVLIARDHFEVLENTRPAHWKSSSEDGLEYAYAPELGAVGFFEDYHDHDPTACRIFHRYINRHLDLTDAA